MSDRISDRITDNTRVWILYEDVSQPADKKEKGKNNRK